MAVRLWRLGRRPCGDSWARARFPGFGLEVCRRATPSTGRQNSGIGRTVQKRTITLGALLGQGGTNLNRKGILPYTSRSRPIVTSGRPAISECDPLPTRSHLRQDAPLTSFCIPNNISQILNTKFCGLDHARRRTSSYNWEHIIFLQYQGARHGKTRCGE